MKIEPYNDIHIHSLLFMHQYIKKTFQSHWQPCLLISSTYTLQFALLELKMIMYLNALYNVFVFFYHYTLSGQKL